jgi:hypothetical protein
MRRMGKEAGHTMVGVPAAAAETGLRGKERGGAELEKNEAFDRGEEGHQTVMATGEKGARRSLNNNANKKKEVGLQVLMGLQCARFLPLSARCQRKSRRSNHWTSRKADRLNDTEH